MIKTSDVIKHFETVEAVATHFNISVQAVYQWGDELPELRQLQLERDIPGVFVKGGRAKKGSVVSVSSRG